MRQEAWSAWQHTDSVQWLLMFTFVTNQLIGPLRLRGQHTPQIMCALIFCGEFSLGQMVKIFLFLFFFLMDMNFIALYITINMKVWKGSSDLGLIKKSYVVSVLWKIKHA